MSSHDQKFYLDVPGALDHLRDENAPLSPAALATLSNATPSTVQLFARAWGTLSPKRRLKIVQNLVELTEDSFESNYSDLFRLMLDDEDATVRAYAVEGLWEDESPALVKPLIALLRSDPSARVRAAAASSLARFALLAEFGKLASEKGTLVHDSLVAVIRNSEEDLDVRRRAIEALAFFGDEQVRGIIAAAYENDDATMRASAVFAMGRSGDKYWTNIVLAELDSNDSELRFEAARAAGEIEITKAVPRLIQLVADPDTEVSNAAIAALGQIGGTDAREALDEIVAGEDEVQSQSAQDALDELTFTEGANLMLIDMDTDREMLDNEASEEDDGGEED